MDGTTDQRSGWSRSRFLRMAAGTSGAVFGGLLVGRRIAGAAAAPAAAPDRQI